MQLLMTLGKMVTFYVSHYQAYACVDNRSIVAALSALSSCDYRCNFLFDRD